LLLFFGGLAIQSPEVLSIDITIEWGLLNGAFGWGPPLPGGRAYGVVP